MAVTTTYIWVTTPWNVDVHVPKIVNLLWVEQIFWLECSGNETTCWIMLWGCISLDLESSWHLLYRGCGPGLEQDLSSESHVVLYRVLDDSIMKMMSSCALVLYSCLSRNHAIRIEMWDWAFWTMIRTGLNQLQYAQGIVDHNTNCTECFLICHLWQPQAIEPCYLWHNRNGIPHLTSPSKMTS